MGCKDFDNDQNIALYFKNLLIDVNYDNIPGFELFHI